MSYNFKMENGKTLSVFYNDLFTEEDKNIFGHVDFHENGKKYSRTVRGNPDGRKFFTWNNEKVYMDSFQAYTPEELVKAFSTGDDNVFGDDICHTLEKHGMDSLHLFIKAKKLDIISFFGVTLKMTTYSSLDKEEDFSWVEYEFVEEDLRMPKDNYKLKLVPADENDREIYAGEDFYVSDLAELIGKRQNLYKLTVPEKKCSRVAV